jgi:hypothetical protein
MFELIFVDRETGRVNYAITAVTRLNFIIDDEVGFERETSMFPYYRRDRVPFAQTEDLHVERIF